MIEIDLNKQQVLDADPRTNQKINFTGNLGSAGETLMFFFLRK